MIHKRSRYARTPTVELNLPGGQKRRIVDLRDVPAPLPKQVHVPAPGERLDHIADRYYRDARRFWRIADASDELDPFDLVLPGVNLSIPSDT